MATYATLSDVTSRSTRPLTTAEQSLVVVRLADVERKIRRRLPELDAWVTASVDYHDNVVSVESDVVLRGIVNPDGYLSETDGNYNYQRAAAAFVPAWELTDDEWSLLGWSGADVTKVELSTHRPLPWNEYPNQTYPGYGCEPGWRPGW